MRGSVQRKQRLQTAEHGDRLQQLHQEFHSEKPFDMNLPLVSVEVKQGGDRCSYRGYIAILLDHGQHLVKRSIVKHSGAIAESTREESYCTAAGGDTPAAPPEQSLRFPLC